MSASARTLLPTKQYLLITLVLLISYVQDTSAAAVAGTPNSGENFATLPYTHIPVAFDPGANDDYRLDNQGAIHEEESDSSIDVLGASAVPFAAPENPSSSPPSQSQHEESNALPEQAVGSLPAGLMVPAVGYAGNANEEYVPTIDSMEDVVMRDFRTAMKHELENVKDRKNIASDKNVKSSYFQENSYDSEVSNIVKRSIADEPVHKNDNSLKKSSEPSAASGDAKADGPQGHSVPRSIMENFAGDFISPSEVRFSDEYFNQEPYYYDIYYDDSLGNDFTSDSDTPVSSNINSSPQQINLPVGNLEIKPIEHKTHSDLKNIASDDIQLPNIEENDVDDASEEIDDDVMSMDNLMEMRMLGADFQTELGYVLSKLTNGTQQRNRRHELVRVSTILLNLCSTRLRKIIVSYFMKYLVKHY